MGQYIEKHDEEKKKIAHERATKWLEQREMSPNRGKRSGQGEDRSNATPPNAPRSRKEVLDEWRINKYKVPGNQGSQNWPQTLDTG